MTKEELFKKYYPEYVTEKGECLSPYWDLFSTGIECATDELNKGCIQTLTKVNAELKEQIEKMKLCQNCKFEDTDYLEKPCCDCTRCLGEDIKRNGNTDKWEINKEGVTMTKKELLKALEGLNDEAVIRVATSDNDIYSYNITGYCDKVTGDAVENEIMLLAE